jgi:hypothetical protein
MDSEREFDCLVFLAEEYGRSRDPKLLAEMVQIEQSCEQLKHRLGMRAASAKHFAPRRVKLRGRC